MLKFILLLLALWLAIRFVGRFIRITYTSSRNRDDDQSGRRPTSFSSSAGRGKVEEAEFEVIDSQIRQKN
ncbi:MAG: hypothetical protein HGA97_06245 [Chlorobiaceae bacterium]|nr:hypothetical protein [Chlorobiaceae bacterium]